MHEVNDEPEDLETYGTGSEVPLIELGIATHTVFSANLKAVNFLTAWTRTRTMA